jgi:hypothetical protein
MHPHSITFGGGANETVLNPFVLVAMLTAMVLFFALPRRFVIIPLLVTIFLIPEGQEFYVAGVHLFVNRLLILAAFTRAMGPREAIQKDRYAGGWTSIDTAFVCYVGLVAIAQLLQYMSVAALIYQLGYVWDYILGYLVLRSLIHTERDTVVVIKCFAALMVVIGAAMLVEQLKMVNIFGLLGGVASVPEVREGKIRSQGVFQHSLTAGTFAATAIPLFVLLWKNYKARLFGLTGMVAATLMTVTTQTSTSLLTQAAGILALFMWPMRRQMRRVRVGLVAVIVALDLVMKAPVWFLIARIDLTGSSSSYHRAELIDQFVNHFSSWWLMGTKDAATWGWDMWDAQNMYVSVGEAGGLAALIFYILVISRSFARLGIGRRRANSKKQEWIIWLLGAALFANVVAFFGVNYFDQSRIAWFALISMICACTAPMTKRRLLSGNTNVTVTVKAPQEVSRVKDAPYREATVSAVGLRSYLE